MDPYAERPTGRGSRGRQRRAAGPQSRRSRAARQSSNPGKPSSSTKSRCATTPPSSPTQLRPDVILRFADAKDLLLSGLLDKGGSIAEHAIVVDAHLGQGNVLLFANNPIYRGETIGTYALVFNAILNYDHLAHEPAAATK